MESSAEIRDLFNEALTYEMSSVRRYLIYAAIQKRFGMKQLSEKFMMSARDAMHGIQKFMDRVVFLDGDPSLESEQGIEAETDTSTQLSELLEMEKVYREFLVGAIKKCGNDGDPGSGSIFSCTLTCCEERIAYIEMTQQAIALAGKQNFLSEMMED